MKTIIILLFFPIIIFAQKDWTSTGTTTGFDQYYIKKSEIIYGDKISFWCKTVFKKEDKEINRKVGDYRIIKYEGSCKEMKMRIIGGAIYDKNGTSKHIFKEDYEFDLVLPDTVGESTLEAACYFAKENETAL